MADEIPEQFEKLQASLREYYSNKEQHILVKYSQDDYERHKNLTQVAALNDVCHQRFLECWFWFDQTTSKKF